MKPTNLTVTKSVLVNTGNYQNERIEVTAEAALSDGESFTSAYAALSNDVNLMIVGELRSLVLNQVDGERLNGRSANRIRSDVAYLRGFSALELFAPAKAEELVNALIETYAAPEPPPAEVQVSDDDAEAGGDIALELLTFDDDYEEPEGNF